MLAGTFIAFAFVGAVFCASWQEFKIDELPAANEIPCMSLGGLCLQKSECPEGKQAAMKGLCPQQQDQGVECCYSAVTKSAKTCRANAGECVPKSTRCPAYLLISKTTDCESDEQCCVMVKK